MNGMSASVGVPFTTAAARLERCLDLWLARGRIRGIAMMSLACWCAEGRYPTQTSKARVARIGPPWFSRDGSLFLGCRCSGDRHSSFSVFRVLFRWFKRGHFQKRGDNKQKRQVFG